MVQPDTSVESEVERRRRAGQRTHVGRVGLHEVEMSWLASTGMRDVRESPNTRRFLVLVLPVLQAAGSPRRWR